jgi:hypothetical protein
MTDWTPVTVTRRFPLAALHYTQAMASALLLHNMTELIRNVRLTFARAAPTEFELVVNAEVDVSSETGMRIYQELLEVAVDE